jgi:hypothetical protein
MLKYYTILLLCLFLANCQSKSDECILIISHQECTGCLDFQIDSGDVKILESVSGQFKEIKLKNGYIKKAPNLTDFKFKDTSLFTRLWGEEYFKVNGFGDTLRYNFDKKYRIKGSIIGFDIKGNTLFTLTQYQELDSIYSKQFD